MTLAIASLVGVLPSPARAAPAEAVGSRVSLEVRLDLIADDAEARAGDKVEADLATRLGSAGVVVDPAAEIHVRLQLRETENQAGDTGFVAIGSLRRAGVKPSELSSLEAECAQCSAADFVAQLGTLVVAKLPAYAAQSPELEPAPRVSEVDAAPPKPAVPVRRRYLPTTVMGANSLWLAPVFTVYGAAGLGVFLGTRNLGGKYEKLYVLGATMGLVGAAVVAVTLPMLAVDIHRYRKQRRLAAGGSFGSRSATLVLRGRF
ncbi:MAG: hypothetical protein IAG13_12855 [Deltaproteobacteria bacterium]|nr:hypothetical protein [Nannocystaceae bacterium]